MAVSSHSGVAASTNIMEAAPTTSSTAPVTVTARAPTRSVSRPASGFRNRAITVAGTNTMPASSAESPQMPCTNKGTMSVMPMNEANRQFWATNAARYWRARNTPR